MVVLAVLFVVACVLCWWCVILFAGLTSVKFVGKALRSRKRYFDFGGHGSDYVRKW